MYRLHPLKAGGWTVFSEHFNEPCHPDIGPEAEAHRLYVDGLDLRQRIVTYGSTPFTIWDVGMGGAANVLTAIRTCSDINGRLNIFSFDRMPAQLEFSLQNSDKLDYMRGFETTIDDFLQRGSARLATENLDVDWRFIEGDFAEQIGGDGLETPSPDAIFFDPHSPRRNPEMWSLEVFMKLRSAIDGRACNLATYSRSTHIRVAMLLAGFFVGRGGGSGKKEETTIAATAPELIHEPLPIEWLKTAERSHAAEPWRGAESSDQPISTETLRRLRAHPQFNEPSKKS